MVTQDRWVDRLIYNPTCLVSSVKDTPNLYFISEVATTYSLAYEHYDAHETYWYSLSAHNPWAWLGKSCGESTVVCVVDNDLLQTVVPLVCCEEGLSVQKPPNIILAVPDRVPMYHSVIED